MRTKAQSGFSWNLGGLLGAAVGCSAWMVLTPFVASWPPAGRIAAIGCALLILGAVPALWRMRVWVGALQGMYLFLAVAFVGTSGFLLCAHFMKLPLLVSWPPPETGSAFACLWILLIFPALALLLWGVDRGMRTKSEEGAAPKP